MESIRFNALKEVLSRDSRKTVPEGKISEYFGENVFNLAKMRQFLSKDAFESVKNASEKGEKINRSMADQVASGMKAWAINKGATHYTHWFQPLTGSTAEKHDSFFEPVWTQNLVIESFDGAKLIQQEPDASSFPGGGLRNTFEARGYTAWDPTSPAFIVDNTLCIPTIFVAYTGDTLDFKAPLLKSLSALDKAATDICTYFDKNVTKVISTLGWEQEYFLVDEALYQARPDLYLCGRTLMGQPSARGQQFEDHYFGTIPERVANYMKDFETESYRLGIPVKTRHNEVAPNQFECAPVFEEANLAVDHNQLLMDIMNKVARKHKFRVLFHEKPFAGVNGSGKHNNWSLMTNTGVNLLSPGKTPRTNLQFLTFLVNTIKAVHDNADLLRASIASPGNEYRLGANEAPPAVMSVFVGTYLTKVLEDIEKRVSNKKMTPDEKTELKLDIGKIPEILLDNTDRNRTSPFAFTGNRFEFRAPGASLNCASPGIALNTSVTMQLRAFKKDVDALIAKNIKKDEAIFQILKKNIIASKAILFEGNGYSNDWLKTAEKRGLTNVKEVPQALKHFVSDKTISIFEKCEVLSKRELNARYEIRLEGFIKQIHLEAGLLCDLAINHIIPTAIKYQNILIENVQGLKQLFNDYSSNKSVNIQLETIKNISNSIAEIKTLSEQMISERDRADKISNIADKADKYDRRVKPFLHEIRSFIDGLEMIVDDEMWPLPKYRELLFMK